MSVGIRLRYTPTADSRTLICRLRYLSVCVCAVLSVVNTLLCRVRVVFGEQVSVVCFDLRKCFYVRIAEMRKSKFFFEPCII